MVVVPHLGGVNCTPTSTPPCPVAQQQKQYRRFLLCCNLFGNAVHNSMGGKHIHASLFLPRKESGTYLSLSFSLNIYLFWVSRGLLVHPPPPPSEFILNATRQIRVLQRHPKARHSCWAWRGLGAEHRFSDDGEPGESPT